MECGHRQSLLTPCPRPPPVANRLEHFALKSFVDFLPVMTQQSMQLVQVSTNGVSTNGVATVAGCAGGRIRVMTNQVFQSSSGSAQDIGTMLTPTADYGLGAAAMHAEFDASQNRLIVWFATCYAPPARPAQYGATSGGALGNLDYSEVAASSVHRMALDMGSGTWVQQASILLTPTGPAGTAPRGAGPVGGLLVADVLPGSPGAELVVASMTGDLIVLRADTLAEVGRTHVGGAVGHYNSLIAADLGGGSAIYIAGSLGLRRITP